MILPLLLAAAAPQMTALDAERAFASDAKTLGQWTAFRKWATDDATMFVPQAVKAQTWLKDRKDPPRAIDWWPIRSYVSCDRTLAVNVGGIAAADGTVGSFTTVWTRQRHGGWHWLMDKGVDLKVMPQRPAKARTIRASCAGRHVIDIGSFVDVSLYRSKDQTLFAGWDDSGASSFFATSWDGRHYYQVIAVPLK